MTLRGVGAAILSVAALCLAGCGSDDSRATSKSLMQRCGPGGTMTVTDPGRDGLRDGGASAEQRQALAANPDAFDLRRVSLKTGNGMLCVSAAFAADDPSGRRGLTLSLAPAKPRLDPDSPLLAWSTDETKTSRTWRILARSNLSQSAARRREAYGDASSSSSFQSTSFCTSPRNPAAS